MATPNIKLDYNFSLRNLLLTELHFKVASMFIEEGGRRAGV
jgi:hypothetical protein